MDIADRNDLSVNAALPRLVLSVLALAAWYVDPSYGGWFFIDRTSLIVLSLHLVYSLMTLLLVNRSRAASILPRISTVLDIAFAAVIVLVTEGPTSPSWLFFVFAVISVDCRTGFRSAIMVTICGALVYFLLLAAFAPGPNNQYLMRSVYLGIIGYLIGFIGAQRAIFEARVHELDQAAERHEIARTLHDGYVQVLAGANLRLETCRTLIQMGRSGECLAQMTDLQQEMAREFDSVRAYLRALANVPLIPDAEGRPYAVDTRFEVTANFTGPAPILEQVLQIVLEGVRNIRRHGAAVRGAINISAADHLIRIAIDDDGVGFRNLEEPPWAIASRVEQYGGRLKMVGQHRGAHLEIEIPAV